MTANEEHYVHYVECIDSLNRAWAILQDLRMSEHKTAIHAAAFRYALVEYAKSYTRSDGIHKHGRNAYKLAEPTLSPGDLSLHRRILDLRNQVLAHSDLTLKEAVVYLGRYGGRASVGLASDGRPPFPGIDEVIGLIERSLDNMYVERTRLEESLAPAED